MQHAQPHHIPQDPEKILHFPAGLLGFEEVHDYVILDFEHELPFKWLQSVHHPELAFVVMEPSLLIPSYQVELVEDNLSALGADDPECLVAFVLVTIPDSNPASMTANLRGPIVVNLDKRRASQLILSGERYSTQHPIFTLPARTGTTGGAV